MHQYFYLGFLPLILGALTVVCFEYLDRSKFQIRGVVGPYFAALALLFGLFASLTASDVWQRIGKANSLVSAEVNALRSLLSLSEVMGAESATIKVIVHDYARELQEMEFTNVKAIPSAKTVEALNRLYQIAADPANFNRVPAIQTEFF